jgi:hypothetical protein
MKKLLLFLTLILSTFFGFSQTYTNYSIAAIDVNNTEIPRYLIGENLNTSTKDTIGIVITIRQALKINTDLEILNLYRGLHKECDSTVNFLVQVVDNYKKANVLAEAQIQMSDSLLKTRDYQIKNLQDQIRIQAERLLVKDSLISAKDDIIALDKKDLKHRLKKKNRWIEGLTALSSIFFYIIIGHPGIK